ncbi:MAG: type II methionyl aminopeptidase [Candidatus Thermoplasmatota archaeon]|nr:type II methionyl aminopeptidase [Candidatus Thermoplasmatota archaeon]
MVSGMENDEIRKWKAAGSIAGRARDIGAKAIAEGVSLLEVAEAVEGYILDRGANVAFPVNLAINEFAAHYTPTHDDKLRFRYGDLVKLDVGAHIDGYIGDTAVTIEVGSATYTTLIEASRRALDSVTEVIKGGMPLSTIGGIVERTMNSMGFRPIVNLTGHSIERYRLHAGVSVPSYDDHSDLRLPNEGVVAVEPFSTTGLGEVSSYKKSNIYRFVRSRGSLTPEQRTAIEEIASGPNQLPFSERWMCKRVEKGDSVLKGLVRSGSVYSYPILKESSGGMVAQSENTLLVDESGCIILTE